MRYLLFLFVLFSCSSETPDSGISSNPNFIKGRVVDSQSKSLAQATVYGYKIVNGFIVLVDTTVSSANGEFVFSNEEIRFIEVKKGSLIYYKEWGSEDSIIEARESISYQAKITNNLDDYPYIQVLIKNTPYSTTVNSFGEFTFDTIPNIELDFVFIDLDSNVISFVEFKESIIDTATIAKDTLQNVPTKIDTLVDTLVIDTTISTPFYEVLFQNNELKDTYVTVSNDFCSPYLNDYNYGGSKLMLLGTIGCEEYKSLIAFDMLELITFNEYPTLAMFNATYDKVVLSIPISSKSAKFTDGDSLLVYSVLKSWKEGSGNGEPLDTKTFGVTATHSFYLNSWSEVGILNNGRDTEKTPIIKKSINDVIHENSSVLQIDITDAYKKWVYGPNNNYGLLLKLSSANSSEDIFISLYSSESDYKCSMKFYFVE